MSMMEVKSESMVSLTKQSMREECDINVIVARARKGQAITHLATRAPSYGDFSDVGDYKTAMDRLRQADLFFAGLSSRVREAFGNDAGEFLEASESPEGRAKLIAAGLVPAARLAAPVAVVAAGGVTPPA